MSDWFKDIAKSTFTGNALSPQQIKAPVIAKERQRLRQSSLVKNHSLIRLKLSIDVK
jgi:hypothetical protein